VNNKELTLSKKLLASYKERLEKEILKRSIKLKIPSKICKEIIDNNNEINQLKKAIHDLENLSTKN
tara:strand:- start:1057 stop:1254 length:198 start_codon:yes stop_codon:yes gene_type:complete